MPANWLPIHKEINNVFRQNEEVMLFGGAGSSKTWTILKKIFERAMLMQGSRHICLRQRFEHTKNTLWPSAKELFVAEWGQENWDMLDTNKSGGGWKIHINGSEVIFGGLDDKERIEKHLGAEYATVYVNECSEILEPTAIDLIGSRLRQKIRGRHMFYMDMNPPPKSHWSYKRFIEEKIEGRASFKINPIDVKENLPESYIRKLQALPERLRLRFWNGEFSSDVEGALWSYDMILGTRKEQFGNLGRIVVGVDPAVTSNENSDETGIIVVAEKGTGYKVLADYSIKGTPKEWAAAATKAYYDFEADCIVAEVNNGGDLVELAFKSINEKLPLTQVRATRGKHIRAEPVSVLYEQGVVEHEQGLTELEDQLQSWVPSSGLKSPDRMDALVWAFHELVFKDGADLSIDFI